MKNRSLAGAGWAAAGMFMATSPTLAYAADPPTLQVVLVDVDDRAGASAQAVERELSRQLQSSGQSISVRRSAQRSFVPGRELGVILLGRPLATAGLSPGVMGAVRRSPHAGDRVWLYVDNIVGTLGIDPDDALARRRHAAAIDRAIGRVLAHEIAHLLLPEREHTQDGLMAARLSGSDLTGDGIGFDGHTRAALVARIPVPH